MFLHFSRQRPLTRHAVMDQRHSSASTRLVRIHKRRARKDSAKSSWHGRNPRSGSGGFRPRVRRPSRNEECARTSSCVDVDSHGEVGFSRSGRKGLEGGVAPSRLLFGWAGTRANGTPVAVNGPNRSQSIKVKMIIRTTDSRFENSWTGWGRDAAPW